MIQPAGLGGTPVEGQRCTAVANASCTASSATSMSPKMRISTATARPYSSRKVRAMSVAVFIERPHLDRETALAIKADRARKPAAPLERGVEIGRLDDGEAADVLLALGERTICHEHVAVTKLHDRCSTGRMQASGKHP